MTVIYGDTLFLLNAFIDYLLLLAAARLSGEQLCRWRFLGGAVLGGLYSVVIFLPQLKFLRDPLCRCACGALIILAAYGGSRHILRQSIIFLAITFAFGGGIFAIGLLGGHGLSLGNGVFYAPLDLKMVLLSGAGCYVLLTMAMSGIARHTGVKGELFSLRIRIGDCWGDFTALTDTGNTLTDPATGSPVIVVEGNQLLPLFPANIRPMEGELDNPVAAMSRLGKGDGKQRFQLLPYRSVGVSRGMLLAAKVDEVWLGGRKIKPRLVALSPTPVSDGGGYCALVGEVI